MVIEKLFAGRELPAFYCRLCVNTEQYSIDSYSINCPAENRMELFLMKKCSGYKPEQFSKKFNSWTYEGTT